MKWLNLRNQLSGMGDDAEFVIVAPDGTRYQLETVNVVPGEPIQLMVGEEIFVDEASDVEDVIDTSDADSGEEQTEEETEEEVEEELASAKTFDESADTAEEHKPE